MNDPVDTYVQELSAGDYYIISIDDSRGLDGAKHIITLLREIAGGSFATAFAHGIFPVDDGSGRAILVIGEIRIPQLSNAVRGTVRLVTGARIFQQETK
jgi:hypothetical protein